MDSLLSKDERRIKLEKEIKKYKEQKKKKQFSNALGIITITAPLVLTSIILGAIIFKKNSKFKNIDSNFFSIGETEEELPWEKVTGTVVLGSVGEVITIAFSISTGILPLESTKEEGEAIKSCKIKQKKLEETIKW